MIIYDINPGYDLLKFEDNHKQLALLKQSYNHNEIRPIFDDVDKSEKYKMFSMLYRNNSSFARILMELFHPSEFTSLNGFLPINEPFDKMKTKVNYVDKTGRIDRIKLSYMERFIKETDSLGVNVVF